MKFFEYFINSIFWLWAFIVPAGILTFLGYLLYARSDQNFPYAILLTGAGIVAGILVAERIRKKYGLSHFFSRLMATPELDHYNNETKEPDNNPVIKNEGNN